MKLSDVLSKEFVKEIIGFTNVEILSLENNSRKINKGSAFFAINGTKINGNDFIDEAIGRGAVAIICESFPKKFQENVSYIKVQNARQALAMACKKFFQNPSEKLKLIGVTGTCGKTSIATLLHELFMNFGYKVGLLSTIQNKINQKIFSTELTTPDVIEVNKMLKQMVDEKCEYCFMEASSHSIDQDRVLGLKFELVIFTNLSHEHLDYHKNLLEYAFVKKKIFDNLSKNAKALINIDDKHGRIMTQNCIASIHTYGIESIGDFSAKVLENTMEALKLKLDNTEVWFKLLGKFNAYNLLAVYAAAQLLGKSREEVLLKLSQASSVTGRFQVMKNSRKQTAILDYAHTPEAVRAALNSVNEFITSPNKVIVVMGCGGDRDKYKRPKIGKIIIESSDVFIATNDNPRTEDPKQIIADILSGIPENLHEKVIVFYDRNEGIKRAKDLAQKNDLIVILGKGHENYQIIGTKKEYFSDVEAFMAD